MLLHVYFNEKKKNKTTIVELKKNCGCWGIEDEKARCWNFFAESRGELSSSGKSGPFPLNSSPVKNAQNRSPTKGVWYVPLVVGRTQGLEPYLILIKKGTGLAEAACGSREITLVWGITMQLQSQKHVVQNTSRKGRVVPARTHPSTHTHTPWISAGNKES